MKKIIILICFSFLISCDSNSDSFSDNDFIKLYQKEICDKYSLYANTKNLSGSLSLYAEDAIVNNNAVEPISGKEKIKQSFVEWYENAETINHSARVISAKVFGDEAFAYGVWTVKQVMKDGTSSDETGHWSTHNKKIGDTWKMTIDHTNDAAFYESRRNQ